MDATWNRGGWIVLLACVCLDYRTLFLSCVSTSPGPMCLSSRARALGDGCRVARWRGVMPSKSFCRQLARLDSSNFRKRTLPCKHTARVNRADGNFRNQPFFSTVVMNQQRCHAHSHTHTHTGLFQWCLLQSAGHPSPSPSSCLATERLWWAVKQ